MPHNARALTAIKIVHTLAWAFFASCVVGIPFAAWARRFDVALVLIGFVLLESLVLVFNKFACPLTAVAARYTDDRSDNFDIYLPKTIARLNKEIFGTLYVAGILFTGARWLGWLG